MFFCSNPSLTRSLYFCPHLSIQPHIQLQHIHLGKLLLSCPAAWSPSRICLWLPALLCLHFVLIKSHVNQCQWHSVLPFKAGLSVGVPSGWSTHDSCHSTPLLPPFSPAPPCSFFPLPSHPVLAGAWHGEGPSSRGPPFFPHLCGPLLKKPWPKKPTALTLLQPSLTTREPALLSALSSNMWQVVLGMERSGVGWGLKLPAPPRSAPCPGEPAMCQKRTESRADLATAHINVGRRENLGRKYPPHAMPWYVQDKAAAEIWGGGSGEPPPPPWACCLVWPHWAICPKAGPAPIL